MPIRTPANQRRLLIKAGWQTAGTTQKGVFTINNWTDPVTGGVIPQVEADRRRHLRSVYSNPEHLARYNVPMVPEVAPEGAVESESVVTDLNVTDVPPTTTPSAAAESEANVSTTPVDATAASAEPAANGGTPPTTGS